MRRGVEVDSYGSWIVGCRRGEVNGRLGQGTGGVVQGLVG